MGITQKSLDRINKYINKCDNMLELGVQNIYDVEHYGMVSKEYFKHVNHTSIDIIEHQGALKVDLRGPFDLGKFDIITNFGTLEHVDGSLYQPLLNIHNACRIDGIMIHENPKTGNWPKHGQHYFTKEFWVELAKSCKYELIEVTEEPAMGNTTDGWNVCAVLRKTKDSKFVSETAFNKIYKQYIKSK